MNKNLWGIVKGMISTLLTEENRTIIGNIEGDSQIEITLYPRFNCSRLAKEKGEMECHYCKK